MSQSNAALNEIQSTPSAARPIWTLWHDLKPGEVISWDENEYPTLTVTKVHTSGPRRGCVEVAEKGNAISFMGDIHCYVVGRVESLPPISGGSPAAEVATPAPVAKVKAPTAADIFAEVLDAAHRIATDKGMARALEYATRRFSALSAGLKRAMSRHIEARVTGYVHTHPNDAARRFGEFVRDCLVGSPVSFPEPTPAVEVETPARLHTAGEWHVDRAGDAFAASFRSCRPTLISPRLDRAIDFADAAERERRVLLAVVGSELRTIVAEILEEAREGADYLKLSARAWEAMSGREQQDFTDWCSALDYKPGEVNYGPLAADERFDVFVEECLEGCPIFPLTSPTDPGPDGTPAYAQEIPPYVQERFKGGFQLVPAPSLAPLVVTFHGIGHPFHQADTAPTPSPSFRNAPVSPLSDPVLRLSDPDTIEIHGTLYGLERTEGGFTLEKRDGTLHEVAIGLHGHASCSCPDFRFRHAGLPTQGCRHIKSLRSVGLIPAQPAADVLAMHDLMPISGGSPEAVEVIELEASSLGNIADNAPNQIKRAIGAHSVVFCGGHECGTVPDSEGQHWDWWLTDEVVSGNFRKVRIVPAS